MNQIELRALAKINLGLDVLGRRENGYHDVRMIMQSIYLYDEVKIIKRKEPGIRLATNLGFLPVGEGNIAYKAAQMLTEEFQLDQGVEIMLDKHIPVAAGLAGGSSDAAAVLFGMNRLFRLRRTQKELMGPGREAGSGCALLHHAGDRAGGRDRRGAERASAHAEVYSPYRQASGQRFHKDCV